MISLGTIAGLDPLDEEHGALGEHPTMSVGVEHAVVENFHLG